MAVDYTPFIEGDVKWAELAAPYSFDDLRAEYNRLYDEMRQILESTTDKAVAYIPHDPDANDTFAANEEDLHVGWSVGHLVAHVTASNEESVLFTSLLARGIAQEGRIRVETPWEEVDTVAKAVQRIEESRRIVMAYFDAMPDEPRLDVLRVYGNEKAAAYFGDINAKGSAMLGLTHNNEHMAQISKTKKQAEEALLQQT
jgi:hypothetical protein